MLSVLGASSIGILIFGTLIWKLLIEHPKVNEAQIISQIREKKQNFEWMKTLGKHLKYVPFENAPTEISVRQEGKNWLLDLTLDPRLQKFINEKLRMYRVDWGAVTIVNPKTGEVLALASHSEKEPQANNLSLTATFPAASIFKVITAAAAIQENSFERNSTIRFSGSARYVPRRGLLEKNGRTSMTVAEAFAKSANAVFAKLGAQAGASLLLMYAERFGFNQAVPFEVFVESSKAVIPTSNDPLDEGRTAAGFGDVTLSPLHGALIAGAAVNDGKIMEPYLVRHVVNDDGTTRFYREPRVWESPMSPSTASEIRIMMSKTVTQGTARKGFRHLEHDAVLGRLDLGGKTGSLTGKNPPGKNEWFVGYARGHEKTIAIGIVLVSEKYWRIKPSELSKEIFRFYFSSKKRSEELALIDQNTNG